MYKQHHWKLEELAVVGQTVEGFTEELTFKLNLCGHL